VAPQASAHNFRDVLRQIANQASVQQNGAANGSAIEQNGDNLAASVQQNGDANSAAIRQFGRNTTGSITQNGSGNDACLLQIGRNGTVRSSRTATTKAQACCRPAADRGRSRSRPQSLRSAPRRRTYQTGCAAFDPGHSALTLMAAWRR